MPLFDFDGQVIKRKHAYLACAMHDQFADATPDEQAKMMKEAYWADYVTDAEWKVVLDSPDANKFNRSRLKRKGAGWLVALAHIASIDPELFTAMVAQAREMHEAQIQEPFPWVSMVPEMCGLHRAVPGAVVRVEVGDPPE